MSFFEYLFCRLYWWKEEKDVDIWRSTLVLSLLQSMNIIPLYSIFYAFLFKSYYIKDVLGVNPLLIIGVIVLIINILHFRKRRYTALFKKLKKIPKEKRKRMDIYCIIYVLTTLVVLFLLMSYFGNKNLGLS